jgi:hypothetical protein
MYEFEVFKGRELHIDREIDLLGGEYCEEPSSITAGSYTFNFEFDLPSNLPQSLSFDHGSIRYYVKAHLDIPWSLEKTSMVNVKISRKDDYSGDSELSVLRTVKQNIEVPTTFSSSSGPLEATVSIPHSVFTPSSTIPITFDLRNDSDNNFNRIYFYLKETINFNR